MARRKGSKRGGKARAKKASHSAVIEENHDLVGEEELPEATGTTPTGEPGQAADPEVDDTGSPSTMEAEPSASPSLDGDLSKDGSGTESETMHTGFMQTGPKNYRCGSTIIDLTKKDEDTTFSFLPNDVALEVECGENKAMMYLSKLYQGSKGHCIEFRGAWITPNEFQTVSGRHSAKDWKRSIRHNGRSLKLLLSKGVLDVHPAACRCDSCRLLQQSVSPPVSLSARSFSFRLILCS